MSHSIEVETTPSQSELVTVHTSAPDEDFDYSGSAERYRQEAEAPNLSPIERQVKLDTADFLAQRAWEVKKNEYSGVTTRKKLGNSALHTLE